MQPRCAELLPITLSTSYLTPLVAVDLGVLRGGSIITDSSSTAQIPTSNTQCFSSPAIFYTFITADDVNDLDITVCANTSQPAITCSLALFPSP